MERPSLGRRAAGEAIGTFALVFAGCGAIATDAARHGALGTVGIGLVFFLVLLAAIAALGHVSGAHFNPGVSLSFFLTRHLPLRDLGAYWAGKVPHSCRGSGTTSGSTSPARCSALRSAHSPTNSRGVSQVATVLFVCLHNAGRSQMSQALFERAAAGRHTALSAGTSPGERVHPEVVEVMRELEIDLADRVPQLLTRDLAEQADLVVTMGCGDECPYIPGRRYLDWDLPDPANRPIDEVRATRDEIAWRVKALLAELDR